MSKAQTMSWLEKLKQQEPVDQKVLEQALHSAGVYLKWFFHRLGQRLGQDRVTQMAGHLAYTSLLSLVPLLTVAVTVFSAFPAFDAVRGQLEDFVFSNFVPGVGEAVQAKLQEFTASAGRVSAVGALILVITALVLIGEIDKALNRIWRSDFKRRKILSFAIYWMVLTLGPVLLGVSVALSGWVLDFLDEQFSGVSVFLLSNLPFLATLLMFTLIYTLVPTTTVRLSHALLGALFTALLFELSKYGFALYITAFPSYQLLYGTLATIPILLLWIYLCWCVILLGAELAATLGEREVNSQPAGND